MESKFEELIKAIQEQPQQSIGSLLGQLVNPQLEIMLAWCSLAWQFDRETVVEVILPACNAHENVPVELEETQLFNHADVQPVPRRRGFYQIKPTALARLNMLWRNRFGSQASHDILPVCRQLMNHFGSRGNDFALDHWFQQLVVAPDQAKEQFQTWFLEADHQFDRARMDHLLQLLERRHPWLGDLQRTLQHFQSYHLARAEVARDFYQTVYYLQRQPLEKEFINFVEQSTVESPWIFHLHAPGGLGKTLFLRWMRARYASVYTRRFPCARVDFDRKLAADLFENTTSQDPTYRWSWFLLPEILRQWSRQLEGNPFHELAADCDQWIAYLGTRRPSQEEVLDGLGMRLARIASIFRETEKPFLLVFDTMEDPYLHRQDALLTMFDMAATLREHCPRLYLILAGRYNLLEEVPTLEERYGQVTTTETLSLFSREESLSYLQDVYKLHRGLPLDAAARKSGGNPFNLSILAELVRNEPTITAETIDAYPDADRAYLIERIVSRIPDNDLRWLLRYGVVLRYLTPESLSGVLKESIHDAITRVWTEDQPELDPLPEKLKPELWQRDEHVPLLDLWPRLMRYAARYSWIMPDDGRSDRLVFHASVVKPMSELLCEHQRPTYLWLHRKALAFFQRRANDHSQQSLAWREEALHHALAIAAANDGQEPFEFTSIVDDYLEAIRRETALDHLQRLSEQLGTFSHEEELGFLWIKFASVALFLIDLGHQNQAMLLRELASNALQRAEQHPSSSPAFRQGVSLLQAALALANQQPDEAQTLLADVDPQQLSKTELHHYQSLRFSLGQTDPQPLPKKSPTPKEAPSVHSAETFTSIQPIKQQAMQLLTNMDYYQAEVQYRRALDLAIDHQAPKVASYVQNLLGSALIEQGKFAPAIKLHQDFALFTESSVNKHQSGFQVAAALKLRFDHEQALDIIEPLLVQLSEPGSGDQTEATAYLRGEVLRLKAQTLTELFAFDQAMIAYDQAIETFRVLQEETATFDTLVGAISSCLWDLGSPRRAAGYLTQVYRKDEGTPLQQAFAAAHSNHIFQSFKSGQASPTMSVDDLFEQLPQVSLMDVVAFVRHTATFFEPAIARRAWQHLLERLEQVPTVVTRLLRLDSLRDIPPPATLDPELGQALDQLLPRANEGPDQPWFRLRLAEAKHLAGDDDEARTLLETLQPLQAMATPVLRLRALQLAFRLQSADPFHLPSLDTFLKQSPSHNPAMVGITKVGMHSAPPHAFRLESLQALISARHAVFKQLAFEQPEAWRIRLEQGHANNHYRYVWQTRYEEWRCLDQLRNDKLQQARKSYQSNRITSESHLNNGWELDQLSAHFAAVSPQSSYAGPDEDEEAPPQQDSQGQPPSPPEPPAPPKHTSAWKKMVGSMRAFPRLIEYANQHPLFRPWLHLFLSHPSPPTRPSPHLPKRQTLYLNLHTKELGESFDVARFFAFNSHRKATRLEISAQDSIPHILNDLGIAPGSLAHWYGDSHLLDNLVSQAGFRAWIESAGRFLLTDKLDVPPASLPHLNFGLSAINLSAFPWELALLTSEMHVGRNLEKPQLLADTLNCMFRTPVHPFKAQSMDDRSSTKRMFFMHPPRELQAIHGRGSTEDIIDFLPGDWQPFSYSGASVEELYSLLQKEKPHVLHLAHTLHFSPGQDRPMLELQQLNKQSKRGSVRGETLTVDSLGSMIDNAGLSGKVLVIIDPPAPGARIETMAQMFLRNAFATELLNQRMCCGVMGMGFTQSLTRGLRLNLYHGLYHSLSEG